MSEENYEPFESIPADGSFVDRALEWSSMYKTLLEEGIISKGSDLSELSNEVMKDMIAVMQKEKLDALKKEYVISPEDLAEYEKQKKSK